MPRRLLVIEGNAHGDTESVGATLSDDDEFVCRRLDWSEFERRSLRDIREDLVLADATSDPSRASTLLERVEAQPIGRPTLVVLPSVPEPALLDLVARVADDFLFPPVREAELRQRVTRALHEPRHELEAVRRQLVEELGLANLIGRDPVFRAAIQRLPRFAQADLPVLITGETGTGKELCARTLHDLGPRRNGPFIAVDCGGVPDALFENELFGHARGAFTDAHRDHRGLITMADGGSLFLDEVDALSLGAQAKLLRFLQERTYRPLGASSVERADLNIIAATNRDLTAWVREKRFRSDLFFRLHVLHLHLPPLRERPSDIGLLACDALRVARAPGNGRRVVGLSPEALRRLARHDWPGNVRELCNVIQRALVVCDGDRIEPGDLDLPDGRESDRVGTEGGFRSRRAAALAAFERRYVEEMLRKHRGNVTRAAREACQDRRAFGRFIKKYGIDRLAMPDEPGPL